MIDSFKSQLLDHSVWLWLAALWVLRAIFVVTFPHTNHGIDAEHYYLPLAKNLLEIGKYTISSAPPIYPEGLKTPGYPVFIALVAFLFDSVQAVLGVQLLIDGLCLALTCRIAFLLAGRKAALLVGFFYCLIPYHGFYVGNFNRDFPQTIFILLSLLFWTMGYQKKSSGFFFAALSTLALSIYMREDAFYIFWLLVLACGVSFYRIRKPAWPLLLATPLILLLVLSPWIYRNFKAFNQFMLLGGMKFSKTLMNANAYFPTRDGWTNVPWPILSDSDYTQLNDLAVYYDRPNSFAGVPFEKHQEILKQYDSLLKKYFAVYRWRYFLRIVPRHFLGYMASPRLDLFRNSPPLFPVVKGLKEQPVLYTTSILSRGLHLSLYVFGLTGLCLLAFRRNEFWFLPLVGLFPAVGAAAICLTIPRYELPYLPVLFIGIAVLFCPVKTDAIHPFGNAQNQKPD